MSPSDQVVQFVAQAAWRNLPGEVQHQARRCLLDTLGALIAGFQAPVANLMSDFAVAHFGGTGATILVSGKTVSAPGAALANGFAGNALDLDDGHRLVKGHPGSCLLPVMLAAAELYGRLPGADFLTALVVGYEVAIRAGLIRHELYTPMHSSGSWGAIGGAAAAGKVLGLEADQLSHALGIAEYHAPVTPVMKMVAVPGMVKDGVGWGAMTGIAAVLFAKQGLTGVQPLFDDSAEPGWVDNLGQQFEVLRLYFKPFSCCRWAQPAVVGALALKRQYSLAADDIAAIKVMTFTEAVCLSRAHPPDTDAAQYNLAYPIAAALVDGELGPAQVLPPRIFDAGILELADRVEAVAVDKYVRAFPQNTYADIEVHLHDGRVLSVQGQQARWEWPDTVPSDGELERKFRALVSPILGSVADELVERIWRFDQVADARELIRLCTAR